MSDFIKDRLDYLIKKSKTVDLTKEEEFDVHMAEKQLGYAPINKKFKRESII